MSFSNNTILVLFGGCSTEYGVSLQSAAAGLAHFPPAYTPPPVGITRDGRWLRYFGPADALPADRWQKNAVPAPFRLTAAAARCSGWTARTGGRNLPLPSRFCTAKTARTARCRAYSSWPACR